MAVPVSSKTELRLVSLPLMDMLNPGRLNRGMLDRDRSEELWGPAERERREGGRKARKMVRTKERSHALVYKSIINV